MFLHRVRKTIARLGLLEKGDKVLIACSGGADSVALTVALMELREEYALRLALAHFNHRLRRSAAADERFVVEFSRRLGLPLYIRREDIRAHARKNGLNIEEAARGRRYLFLRQAAARISARKIATAHTLTDQAETVLMRILRGSGPSGLAGIAPCLDGLIIRPLIEVERRDVEAFLRERKASFCRDETNRDTRYLRNRVRLKLIPYLERNFEPGVVRQLGRLAEICREEEKVWERITQEEMKGIVRRSGGGLRLDAVRLSAMNPALGRRCVRAYLQELRGNLRRLSFHDVESVRGLAEGKEAVLPGGLVLSREKGLISIKKDPIPPVRYEYEWDGEKELSVTEAGLSFSAKRIPGKSAGRLRFDDDRRAFLDVGMIRFPIVVRSRRDADRYRPLGAPGRKKLKEIMRAKGIAAGQRDRHPVFLSGDEIIWVPGLPVADAFKVTPSTRRLLVIEET
ncbi:MAG: tRNA lysidine(34) synthetase TilS [Candidatus Aminicenantes bacterium]|nr:tRNA lysidine(34) synthetase TilS [Candidatus Aminicenantes bacterium]